MQASRAGPRRQTQDARRLRGMSGERRRVGASPSLPRVWSCRLLRRFSQPPRHEAFPQDEASGDAALLAWRGLGLLLRGESEAPILARLEAAHHRMRSFEPGEDWD